MVSKGVGKENMKGDGKEGKDGTWKAGNRGEKGKEGKGIAGKGKAHNAMTLANEKQILILSVFPLKINVAMLRFLPGWCDALFTMSVFVIFLAQTFSHISILSRYSAFYFSLYRPVLYARHFSDKQQ